MFIKAFRGLSRERALHHDPIMPVEHPHPLMRTQSLIRCSSIFYLFLCLCRFTVRPFKRVSSNCSVRHRLLALPLQLKIMFQLFSNMINAITVRGQ